MNRITPEFLAKSRKVFKHTWPSLEDVYHKVQAQAASPRKRDILAAFGVLKSGFKVNLAATPATWPVLRRIFSSKAPAELGLSDKRFANIRSYVFRAVKEFGVPSPTLTKAHQLAPSWETLLAIVQDKNYRASLRRLACFCSAMDISPDEVGKQALLGLYEALQAEGGVKDPKIILRHVTSYWNYHEARIEGWPRIRLETPFATRKYQLCLDDLPKTLQQELAAWQKSRLGGNILSLEKVGKKSRPRTVDHQTGQLLRYMGILVQNNLAAVEDLKSFRSLVQPKLVLAAATILVEKMGRSAGYTHQYTYTLLSIAKHYTDLPQTDLKQLAALSANLRDDLEAGMAKKNRILLQQFNRQDNVDKLLAFPEEERKRGRKERHPYRQAKFFERALVVELLLYSLLRIENITHLHIDRNMRKCGQCYILTFAGSEMKNGHGHEVELPHWMTENIDQFIKIYRPRLDGAEGLYFFPGKIDGARHYSAIRIEFTKVIRKRCGLIVNPHLLRHLGAKLILDRDPSLIYSVSRQLGHLRLETTEEYYLENDSLSASRSLNKNRPKPSKK